MTRRVLEHAVLREELASMGPLQDRADDEIPGDDGGPYVYAASMGPLQDRADDGIDVDAVSVEMQASMGPLQDRADDCTTEPTPPSPRRCFNGAAPMQSG